MLKFRLRPDGFLRFRCSRTFSTLRSGSRKPSFSAQPDLNSNTPRRRRSKTTQPNSTQTGRWSDPRACRSAHRRFSEPASEALVKT
ncbi:hypothetical protein EOA75_08530 [Mesorhizobium sp. M1A.F.Ca.IN.022.07.1.1]|nr:hypothetical protein EOA75_08530 [Mesorhizobium sp. M1A.F.Ca.IN.022.07.1.1]RWF98699.1 MAG: hypothetical protein EOQ54_31190 [Mesorhizobium sp.]RWG95466.1 MAG: hypothetical protein EOQ72_24625 [Mesorhizobium sp.]TIR93259.1 MAG: hypothetical protein E5X08_10965 [Mesorhizobium sp.]TIS03143.1 MAG: hypothetical protein E5X13_07215 [Mesorhizobium sp.]